MPTVKPVLSSPVLPLTKPSATPCCGFSPQIFKDNPLMRVSRDFKAISGVSDSWIGDESAHEEKLEALRAREARRMVDFNFMTVQCFAFSVPDNRSRVYASSCFDSRLGRHALCG